MEEHKRKEFEKVVEPVMEWLSENFHPNVKVVIDYGRAELVEGMTTHVTDKFIKD